MNIKEVKKPIGFASWNEETEKEEVQKKYDFDTSYEDKFNEYDDLMINIIEENAKLKRNWLKAKRYGIILEMENIELKKENKKLKKKLKKLKKAKD